MEAETRGNLGAEVEALAKELCRELIEVLDEELAGGVRPGQAADASAHVRAFLDALAAPADPYFAKGQVLSAALWRRLQERWVDRLRRSARRGDFPGLKEVLERYTAVVAIDGARLEDIGQRLKLESEDGALGIPGSVLCLHDLSRGLPLRLWVEPDPGRRGLLTEALKEVEKGWLVLGDGRYATPEAFERLIAAGAHGIFRVGPRDDLLPKLQVAEVRFNGTALRDLEVELLGGARTLRLRQVALTHHQKTSHAVLTDIIDPDVLPASMALRLAAPRWRVDRIFADLAPVVNLHRFNAADPARIEAQVRAAAILLSTFHAAQYRIAETRALPPQALSAGFFFPRLLRAAGGSRPAAAREPSFGGRGAIPTFDAVEETGALRGGPIIPAPVTRLTEARPAAARRPPQPASRDEMLAIGRSQLNPAFEPFTQGYAEVGHRDNFLWRWVQRGLELTALPGVEPALAGPNLTVKMLGVMLDVLLDDVADNLKDGDFLELLLDVVLGDTDLAPPPTLDEPRRRYFQFLGRVWREIARLAAGFPRYGEFRHVFEFDYRQLLNTMRYALLVNRLPESLNPIEHDTYQPHNMHMIISGTLDLMCSPAFDRHDLGLVRQALWRGQMMGRIGNMVSTWEREIKERDFTSGVFAAAIDRGVVHAADLNQLAPDVLKDLIEKSGVIEHFLLEWERLRDEVYILAERVHSVDLATYAGGLEELIRNHLGSRGLK